MSLPSYVSAISGDLSEDNATCTTTDQRGDASSDSGPWIDIDKLTLALSALSLSPSVNDEERVQWPSEVSKKKPNNIKVVILTPDSQSNAKEFTLTLPTHFYFIFNFIFMLKCIIYEGHFITRKPQGFFYPPGYTLSKSIF